MRRHSYRYQRTIARPAEVRGIGFLTGATIRLCFQPAPPSTGVVFVRTDLGPQASIPVGIDQVTGTHRRTTLGRAPLQVGLESLGHGGQVRVHGQLKSQSEVLSAHVVLLKMVQHAGEIVVRPRLAELLAEALITFLIESRLRQRKT